MAKILCVSSTVPGMLYAGVELARRLGAAGHDVMYACPRSASVGESGDAESTTRNVGLAFEQFSGAVDSAGLGRFVALIDREAPDLLLIDGEMHEHILAAAGTGVPMAVLNAFVSIWRRPGLPPPSELIRPGVGFWGSRTGMLLAWRRLLIRKRLRVWRLRLRGGGKDRWSRLRSIANQSGVDWARDITTDQWLMPITYRRLPALSLHARAFEFPHRPASHVHYVGPMVLRERADASVPAISREALDACFARRQEEGGALIYAGFGSFLTARPRLLANLVDAAASRPDWQLLISLGGRTRPGTLDSPPPNVHVFDWLPQLEVLEHADVAITHGGINTIEECVLAAVPMLVFCGYETDMAGNTARVLHHRIGLVGGVRTHGADAIRRALDQLLEEPGFRDRIEALRAAYREEIDERSAEGVVEKLLASPPARLGG